MKTILQFAFATLARIDMTTFRRLWATIETLVSGFELAKFTDGSLTGAQKLEYVLERTETMIPDDRQQIASQIIRAIVEIVLIGIRLKGGAK